MNFVIIGNSAAGVTAAETIRKQDKKSYITIISREKYTSYSRCLISRFLDERLKENEILFKAPDFCAKNDINEILNKTVVNIDRKQKIIQLDDNTKVPYDKLLIATGSDPAVPKIQGLDLRGVYTFYSLDDAKSILQELKNRIIKCAVVVGGSFVGLEVAYALVKHNVKTTIIEKCSQLLPSQFDACASSIIMEDIKSLQIECIFNQSITSINGTKQVESVTIGTNFDLPCDIVVFATGVRPNVALAKDAALATANGIVVDEHLNTSDKSIFAAGDCIEIQDKITGNRQPSATWINAVLQGKYAALNMCGENIRYDSAVGIQNALQFHRVPAISYGITQLKEEDIEYSVASFLREDRKVYRKMVFAKNTLKGMTLVGDISKAGVYSAMIRESINLNIAPKKLLESDFNYSYFIKESFGQYSPFLA